MSETETATAKLSGIFADIEKARASRGGVWVEAGHYIYKINRIKIGKSRKEEQYMCLEMTILHAYDGMQKVGQDVSHMLWVKHESFKGNVKAMIAAITGYEEDQVTEEACEEVCLDDGSEEAQPLAGVCVESKNVTIRTRADNPFTKVQYQRCVPFSELVSLMSEDNKNMIFPGGELDKLAAAEDKD